MSGQLTMPTPVMNNRWVDRHWVYRTLTQFDRIHYKKKQKILGVIELADGAWVCGSYFYANYLPTFSQRISEFRTKEGLPISEGRPCTHPDHNHDSTIAEYRWEGETDGVQG